MTLLALLLQVAVPAAAGLATMIPIPMPVETDLTELAARNRT